MSRKELDVSNKDRYEEVQLIRGFGAGRIGMRDKIHLADLNIVGTRL